MTITPDMTPEQIAEATVSDLVRLMHQYLADIFSRNTEASDLSAKALRDHVASLASAIIDAHRPKRYSIKDNLPDEHVSVLVWCETGYGPMRLVAYRHGNEFVVPATRPRHVIEDVTDWQHLPDGGTATVKA